MDRTDNPEVLGIVAIPSPHQRKAEEPSCICGSPAQPEPPLDTTVGESNPPSAGFIEEPRKGSLLDLIRNADKKYQDEHGGKSPRLSHRSATYHWK
jgi:hypothetical protein